MTEKKRFDNFDALRIYAMFLIVLWHYVLHGGALSQRTWDSRGYHIAQLLHVITIIGVNLYVMLTGYFQSVKTFRAKKLWDLWGITFFYSAGIGILFCVFGTPASKTEILFSFLPILGRQYWFITCYFALYLFSPYLNRALDSLEKKDFTILIVLLLLFTSVFPTFLPQTMALNPMDGYGLVWFITLYCVGAYFRRYASCFVAKQKIMWCIYLLSGLALYFASKGGDALINYYKLSSAVPAKIFSYNSPFVFLAAAACFILFSNFKFNSKLVQRIAPLTLGIYLIHDNHFVRSFLYTKIFHVSDWYDSSWFALAAIGSSILIFSVCALIEQIRRWIFRMAIVFFNRFLRLCNRA